jgi:hypothetical protein
LSDPDRTLQYHRSSAGLITTGDENPRRPGVMILIFTTTIFAIPLLTTALRTSSSLSVSDFALILPLVQLFQFLLDSTDLLMESLQLFDEVLDLLIRSIIAATCASTLVSTEVMFLGECGLPRVDMDACWQHESANEQQEAAVDG